MHPLRWRAGANQRSVVRGGTRSSNPLSSSGESRPVSAAATAHSSSGRCRYPSNRLIQTRRAWADRGRSRRASDQDGRRRCAQKCTYWPGYGGCLQSSRRWRRQPTSRALWPARRRHCRTQRFEPSANRGRGHSGEGLGVIGGYIAASAGLCDFICSFASGFIFTTALSPAVSAGAINQTRQIAQPLRCSPHGNVSPTVEHYQVRGRRFSKMQNCAAMFAELDAHNSACLPNNPAGAGARHSPLNPRDPCRSMP